MTIKGKSKSVEEIISNTIEVTNRNKDLNGYKHQIKLLNQALNTTIQELEATKKKLDEKNQHLLTCELTILENEEKFRLIFENVPILIYAINKKGKCILWNKECERTFGWTIDEINSKDEILRQFYPNNRMSLLDSVPKENLKECTQLTKKRKLLTVLWVNYKASDKLIINFGHDITVRKHSEEKLRETKDYYQALIENSYDTMSILDERGQIIYESPSHNRILGYEKGTLLNKSVFHMLHKDDVDRILVQFAGLVKKPGCVEEVNFRFRHINNTWVHFEGTALNLLNTPEIRGIVVNSHDVTSRINTEKVLIAAKEKAEESDRLKSSFLSNLSHEIRTPMNGILGFLKLLNDPLVDSIEKQSFINSLEVSSERLLDTLDQLIDISKIDAGLIEVTHSMVNLNDLLLELHDDFNQKAIEKRLALSFSKAVPDNKSVFNTDYDKLSGIFKNIIDNAIKYTEKGSIDFGYLFKKDYVEFYVVDTGIGIPFKRHKAIFNSFEQASNGNSRTFEGLGLGLSIAKAYIELLNGKIWYKYDKTEGSCFRFTVPYNVA